MTGNTAKTENHLGSIRRLVACILQLSAYILGCGAFVAAFFGSAVLFDSIGMLVVAGLIAAIFASALISWLASVVFRVFSRRRYIVLHSVISLTIVLVSATVLLFYPLVPESRQYVLTADPEVKRWTLSTGSTVAVRKYLSKSDKPSVPIVYLHGGPGAYSVNWKPTHFTAFELSQAGYDVYVYDQIGGGLSDRLDNIANYTLDRHVRDLEALRQRIGAEQVIVLASSFGATLASYYMAEHPSRVSKAVFSAPGPIYSPDWVEKSDGSLDEKMTVEQKQRFDSSLQRPRLFAAIILSEINPKAAVRFASEREMGSFFDEIANDHYMALTTCEDQANTERVSGYGFWSNRMTGNTLENPYLDPKPRLNANRTPVLVLRGECDYKVEEVALQYTQVFPNATYRKLDDAGHMIYIDKPIEFVNLVKSFLAVRSK